MKQDLQEISSLTKDVDNDTEVQPSLPSLACGTVLTRYILMLSCASYGTQFCIALVGFSTGLH